MMSSKIDSNVAPFIFSNHGCSDGPSRFANQHLLRRPLSKDYLKKVDYYICAHGKVCIPSLRELHQLVRERRRSRSNSTAGRSRTPSSVSSGRTTPSPAPSLLSPLNGRTMSDEALVSNSPPKRKSQLPRKYRTECWLEPHNVPVNYSSTVLIILGSTRKCYMESVKFQTRLTPKRFSETVETPVSHHYTSTIEIPCNPHIHMFDYESEHTAIDSEA